MSAAFPLRPKLEAMLPEEVKGPQLYVFTEDFTHVSPKYGVVVIPAGFTTDFASIPSAALFYLDDDDPRILLPSCVHDYRYKTGNLPRQEADEELRQNMIACGARPSMAAVVYRMVRLFGGSHYSNEK